MNVIELPKLLSLIGIPPEVLAIGGHAENCWCIEQSDAQSWEVYWRERGSKIGLAQFAEESEACLYLLGRLTYSQLLADAIGVK